MNYLFADTANLDEIKVANDMGVIQGVTTNPSIIAKEPQGSFDDLIMKLSEYCGAEKLSLSVEVFAEEYDAIVKQACEIYEKFSAVCPDLYVKIPVGFDELRAIKTCSKNGVKINATICYSEQQLIHCASAGAKYVSLFYCCRLKQHGGDVERALRRTDVTFLRMVWTLRSSLVVFAHSKTCVMRGIMVLISLQLVFLSSKRWFLTPKQPNPIMDS